MKLVFLCVATLFLCPVAKSQVKFGVFGGAQATSASYTIEGKKQSTSFKPGIQLGGSFKIPIEGKLSIGPSFMYSMKGYKVKFTEFSYPPGEDAVDNNTTFHNIELGFPLQYDFAKGDHHVFIRTGPALDFQFFGRETFNTVDDEKVKRNIPFGYDKYGHYSANWLVHFGYEMKDGVFVYCQYTHGIANISNKDGGPGIRHRAFGITVGKYIRKSKTVL